MSYRFADSCKQQHAIAVCINSISPMVMGCFICVNINPLNDELNPICHFLSLLGAHHILHVSRIRVNLVIFLIHINSFVISGGILFKMLVLGINEMAFAFHLKF